MARDAHRRLVKPGRLPAAGARRYWLGLLALGIVTGAHPAAAQQPPDVPYVQTPSNVVDVMLDMAAPNADDYLVDLGSGDGRIVIQAAKKHAVRGHGIEIDSALVRTSNQAAKREGVADKVSFVNGNLFVMDLSRASVLTMYLLPQLNIQLRPRLLSELRPGTRVVSHDFDMGDWKPDQKREVSVPNKSYGPPVSQVYLWYVPANVAGKWRWQLPVAGKALGYEARLSQLFQEIDAEMLVDGGSASVQNLKLRGDQLSFTLTREIYGQKVNHDFTGRVEGDSIVGRVTLTGGGENATHNWQAARVERGLLRTHK